MNQAPPHYWMNETSGILRPAVEAYLGGEDPMTPAHIAALRAYIRQWIMAPAWDTNPDGSATGRAELAGLRGSVDSLTNRQQFNRWLHRALDLGIDPL